ncbi:DUF2336 domain-containing protein [Brevundimonas sp.]|uniref:DUF2336 domain-containing protein n=1 Tax=Brevundimonas sp. TaxID=1871086 RepID=UPI0025FC740B|nr:DUF2336 domain-containing protein [Brevundimonas sp.]
MTLPVQAQAVTDTDPADAPEAGSRARRTLLKRLADVVSLPASRVNAFERAVTGDLLVEMLRLADPAERLRVAHRLAPLAEIPDSLVRLLLRDDSGAAQVLLEECASLTDSDLIACAHEAGPEQRFVMAGRRGLSPAVCDALVAPMEPAVVERLLRNPAAHLSQIAIEEMVAASRETPRFIEHLLKRPELRPSSAYVMFWWCGPEDRRTILSRFAVSREVMQEIVDDVFAMAAEEGWQDPLARKALQFIERRQRNRAAVEKSPYDSLDDAVAAAETGLTREIVSEIAYLAGLKPTTGAKILSDPGGEPVAVLCKATGLPRDCVRQLWRAVRRPETTETGETHPDLERVLITYDMIAVDRAQTVTRYWNWSLSSALTPNLMRAIRDGDDEALDEYSVPQRAAMLALAQDFGR